MIEGRPIKEAAPGYRCPGHVKFASSSPCFPGCGETVTALTDSVRRSAT